MSTLDTRGMLLPFKVDRQLSQFETANALTIDRPVSSEVQLESSLLKLNQSFVESVDKWFLVRGWVAMISGAGVVVCGAMSVFAIFATIDSNYPAFLLIAIAGGALAAINGWAFFRDVRTFTHYPIRFNRKNRHVYVFRRDGSVLKVRWDSVCWVLVSQDGGAVMKDAWVAGHVMADDGKTIKESFALSVVDVHNRFGIDRLKRHFEFFRRYMNDGPEAVMRALAPQSPRLLPPLDQRRETWAEGWRHLTDNFRGVMFFQVVMQVIYLPMSLFRWVVMHTSRIPRWPQWVEDECAAEPGDPWLRDGRSAEGP